MFVKKQKWPLLLALAGLLFFFYAGCGKAKKQGEDKHWGYLGETGPEYWYTLDSAFVAAKEGKAQSPIDIQTASLEDGNSAQKPIFTYSAGEYELENNGHTFELKPKSGGNGSDNAAIIDGDTYTLKQIHFHLPSEHHLDGKSFDMEVHFVHQNSAGSLAVVGFFIIKGAENNVFKETFEKLPDVDNPVELETTINLAGLFNTDAEVYRYDGSLTTPPCTEGVKWLVSSQLLEFSMEQIDRFRAAYNGNNRPIQPLNDRVVYRVD